MRFAIVDNSTLTAAERLLGRIPVHNKYSLEGDLSALESLVHAILFYDRLFYVDDYKKKYRAARKEFFSFLTPISKADMNYDQINAQAKQLAEEMTLRAQYSMIQDGDFRPFIELLKMNMVFTWRFHSSVYWLTVSCLGRTGWASDIHKYSKLWQAIRGQLDQASLSDVDQPDNITTQFSDRFGREFNIDALPKGRGIDGSVRTLIGSLSWLAHRTAFYSLIAQGDKADVVLHPIRHSFRANFLRRHLGMDEGVFGPLLNALNEEYQGTTKEILAVTQPIVRKLRLPLFSAYAAAQTKDVRDILKVALQMREASPFSEAREVLGELERLKAAGDQKAFIKRANELLRNLDGVADELRRTFGRQPRLKISTSPVVIVLNAMLQFKTGFSLPNLGLKIPLPNSLSRLRSKKAFRGVFRSIVSDFAAISSLGAVRTKLTSAVQFDPHARRSMSPLEDVRFFGKDSGVREWK